MERKASTEKKILSLSDLHFGAFLIVYAETSFMKLQQTCIICGSPVFAKNLCEKCFLERHELFQVPEKIELRHCTSCGGYYDRTWINDNMEEILERKIIAKNDIVKKELKIVKGRVTFTCRGFIKPSRKIKEEKKTSLLMIERRKCDDCIKMLSGYYQAVIQVRGENAEKILKKVLSVIKEGITVEKIKHGYDVRFISKNTAFNVSRVLGNFTIKKTYKLITEKKGKKLYRDFYSVR